LACAWRHFATEKSSAAFVRLRTLFWSSISSSHILGETKDVACLEPWQARKMPSKRGASHQQGLISRKGAVLCRKPQPQQPFVELNGNQHSSSHYSRKPFTANKNPPRNLRYRGETHCDKNDIFCQIPVEDLDQQGVFAVRDVLVTEKPLYIPPPAEDKSRPTSSRQRVSAAHNQRKTTKQTESSLDDWSKFLDLLLPSLCSTDQGPQQSTKSVKTASTKPKKTMTEAKSCGSDGPSFYGTKILTKSFDDRDNNMDTYGNRGRQQPPPSYVSAGSSPPPVVYPIAKYPSRLNNRHLVEQRRLSLRQHLTFRPVPPAE